MKYFEEEKELLEKIVEKSKEMLDLRHTLLEMLELHKENRESETSKESLASAIEAKDMVDKLNLIEKDIEPLTVKLCPPPNFIDKLLGRKVGHWTRWLSKAKTKIEYLPNEEERKEAKIELDSLMPLHNKLKRMQEKFREVRTVELKKMFHEEGEWGRNKEMELDNKEKEIDKRIEANKAELRRRGEFELIKQLDKENEELKRKMLKQ